jgi:hypothetical protein
MTYDYDRRTAAIPLGVAVLKKLKKGDRVKIEASWLKKPRVVEVQSPAQEGKGGNLVVYVSSGSTRPGHVQGGSIEVRDNKLYFQPTMLQQIKEISRVSKI